MLVSVLRATSITAPEPQRLQRQIILAVTNDRSIVDVATSVLDSGGSIGDDNASLRLIQGSTDTIDVTANGGVFIESREGNLKFCEPDQYR